MISCYTYGFWNSGVGRYGGWDVQVIISVSFFICLCSVGWFGRSGRFWSVGTLSLFAYHTSFLPNTRCTFFKKKSRELVLRVL